jgi:hypothetical protein
MLESFKKCLGQCLYFLYQHINSFLRDDIALFSRKKTYTAAGFEPGPCAPKADAMSARDCLSNFHVFGMDDLVSTSEKKKVEIN